MLAGADDPHTQARRLAEIYPLVVIKRGADGCEAATGASRWRVEAPKVEAVDTTGAGDAFVAAFLSARLAGVEIEAQLLSAVEAGRQGCDAPWRRAGTTKRSAALMVAFSSSCYTCASELLLLSLRSTGRRPK